MAAVTVTAPAMSNSRARMVRRAVSRGRKRGAASTSASATGTGRKNVARQLSSVSSPPNTRPSDQPLAPVAA